MPLPTYLMSNFPSVRPSLNLQFDSQPTPEDMTSHLASVGATFSRASIGTYTDANGIIQEATAGQARPNYSSAGVHEGLLIEESRTNLIKVSEDLTDLDWGKEADVFVLENQAIAPDGKASADKLVYPSTNQFHRLIYSLSVTNGTTYSFSAYVKADGYDFVLIRWESFVSAGQNNISFDLVDVEVDYVSSSFDSASIEAVGNDWYKITVVGTAYADDTSVFRIRFQPTANTDNNIATFTGDDESGGFLWGVQFEEGSFATSYIPTIPTFTSRASDGTYFDSSGVLQTASTDEERIDHKYIDGQWVEAGLLLEGASTNLLVQSEDFSTEWVNLGTRATLTSNDTTAPDGNTTADKFTANSTSENRFDDQSITVTAGVHTASVFVKNVDNDFVHFLFFDGSGDGCRQWFNVSNGTVGTSTTFGSGYSIDSASIEDVGNGWYRCSATIDIPDTTITFGIGIPSADGSISGVVGQAIHVWGAQLEAQSQPTSYIATSGSEETRSADVYTTATKQRSADVCYIDGTAFTDFYNQEEGTVFVKVKGVGLSGIQGVYDLGASATNSVDLRLQSDGTYKTIVNSGGETFNAESVAKNLNTTKLVTAYKQDDFVFSADDTNLSTDTSGNIPSAGTKLNIGTIDNNSLYRACIVLAKFIYFPRRLGSVGNNAEIQKLTQ